MVGAQCVLVLLATLAWSAAGYAVKKTPLDALPDLSDTQVIVFTPIGGRPPGGGRPGDLSAHHGRWRCPRPRWCGFSMFGASLRVRDLRGRHRHLLGRLAGARIPEFAVQGSLPGRVPQLGPDATGVGWSSSMR